MLLSVAGGFQDARLLLPGWISIATVRPIATPNLEHDDATPDLDMMMHPPTMNKSLANPHS